MVQLVANKLAVHRSQVGTARSLCRYSGIAGTRELRIGDEPVWTIVPRSDRLLVQGLILRGILQDMPIDPTLKQTETLLDALLIAEYSIRKYRTRGDAKAECGNHRAATEYHALAATEVTRAREILAKLNFLHGTDGGPGVVLVGVLELARIQKAFLKSVQDSPSFEDACFYRRHPIWASRVDRYQASHEKWNGKPELETMAPGFHPIYDGWTD